MKILLLLPSVILPLYAIIVSIRFGIQTDFSHTWHVIRHKWLFTLVLWLSLIPIIIVANTWLMFLAASFLCVVGAAPDFFNPFERKVHVTAAFSGLVLMMLSLAIDFHLSIPVLAYFIVAFMLERKILKIKYHTLWVEIIPFIITLVVLWIYA